MKLAFWLGPIFLAIAAAAQSQTFSNDGTYTVQGATPQREALLRHQVSEHFCFPSRWARGVGKFLPRTHIASEARSVRGMEEPMAALADWPAEAFSLMKTATSVKSGRTEREARDPCEFDLRILC